MRGSTRILMITVVEGYRSGGYCVTNSSLYVVMNVLEFVVIKVQLLLMYSDEVLQLVEFPQTTLRKRDHSLISIKLDVEYSTNRWKEVIGEVN